MKKVKKDILTVILEAIRVALLDTHTSIPAIVESVAEDKTSVTVNVSMKRLFNDGEGGYDEREFKPIPSVPVVFPSAGNFNISFPVVKGDEGVLVFSEKDIQEFLKLGEVSTPASIRRHALEDCVFIPAFLSKDKRSVIPEDGIVINAGENNSITLTDSGITIKGDVTFENEVIIEANLDVTTGDITAGGDIDGTNVSASAQVEGATVTNGMIDLALHTHTDSTGGLTGPALP